MELEAMEEFEEDLRQAFERRPAPPSLKRKLRERRRAPRPRSHAFMWQRLAACLTLAAVVGGAAVWHQREERRKGEAAREQVLIALRITGHALNHMNQQLAAHGRASQE